MTFGPGARRVSQTLVFFVFAFLFLKTEYQANDVIEYAVNVFLRLDPYIGLTVSLASRTISALLWPCLVTVAVALFAGRILCGWACPMGATLDFTSATVWRKAKRPKTLPNLAPLKYVILAFTVASSALALQWAFFFDPISILIRSLAVAVYPALNLGISGVFDPLYSTPAKVVSEPVYGLLRDHFMALSQPYFESSVFVGLTFLGILALEGLERRFWCKNLCPLGAMMGLLGKFSPLKRFVDVDACTSCSKCSKACPTKAVTDDFHSTKTGECVYCMDCVKACPEDAISFGLKPSAPAPAVVPSRRALIVGLALAPVTVGFAGASGHKKNPDPFLVRPPGAKDEAAFLASCTRCGECMRVCVANGLQPAIWQAGVEGLWSPVLISRIGYCEYNCSLCGQVCPTGAIKRLTLPEKHAIKIGLANVDRSHCLPWKGESPCIVCEEHCPTPKKAIRLEDAVVTTPEGTQIEVKRPVVDEKLCVGCGICENKCPLVDRSAIYVTSRGETRRELVEIS